MPPQALPSPEADADSFTMLSPRSGHLGTTWEVAVICAFIVVLIGVVIVVILQIRRTKRRREQRRTEEEAQNKRRKLPRSEDLSQSDLKERDLERGNVHLEIKPSSRVDAEDGDFVDDDAAESHREPKSKRHSRSSKPVRPSPTQSKKSSSSKDSTDPESYYFEHPSQKPPKYYWDHR